jgi:hypothetical protein
VYEHPPNQKLGCHQKEHVNEDKKYIDRKSPKIPKRPLGYRKQVAVPAEHRRCQRGDQYQQLLPL